MERHLEEAIARYPELIEDGLTLEARQATIAGRRIDLLFRDQNGRRLLIELKWGPVKDEHVTQILSYAGRLVSPADADLRLMLLGTRVPQPMRNGLEHLGIAAKELPVLQVAAYFQAKGEHGLAAPFLDCAPTSKIGTAPDSSHPSRASKLSTSQRQRASTSTSNSGTPAILAIVEAVWVEQAIEIFRQGRVAINFGTNSLGVRPAFDLAVERVYFKAKSNVKGDAWVTWVAKFAGMAQENNPERKFIAAESDTHWAYYYGFESISVLPAPFPLSDLRYYRTGNKLLNSVPGSCVIRDPFEED